MWGLPDSAVLGTTKRLLKKSGKNKHRLSPTKSKDFANQFGSNFKGMDSDLKY